MDNQMQSEVWQHFDKMCGSKNVQCKLCSKILKRNDGSTGSMKRHLQIIHCLLKEVDSNNKEKQVTTMDRFLTKEQDEQRNAEELVAKMMIRQNSAFTFIENMELRKMFSTAFPKLKLPHRNHFRTEVIPRMAENVRCKIKENLSGFFSITSDGWSQPTKSPNLYSVTVHSVNCNFTRTDNVLATFSLDDKHSGENIANSIKATLAENDLLVSNVMMLVRDDASNMRSTSNILGVESFQCVCHFLHLVVNDLFKQKDLMDIVDKVKKWVKESRTNNGAAVFKRHGVEKKLIMSVPTRWNSIYNMMISFREQKKNILSMEQERQSDGIFNFGTSKRAKRDMISADIPKISIADFIFLRHLCSLLKIFDTETQKFSRENSTASTVLPTLRRIRDFLRNNTFDPPVQQIAADLANSINTRVDVLVKNNVLRMASLLDPRFAYDKDVFSPYCWSVIEDDLKQFARKVSVTDPQPTEMPTELVPSDQSIEIAEEASPEFDLESSDESLQMNIWQNPKSPDVPSTISGEQDQDKISAIEAQLAIYKTISRPSFDSDVFSWWRENGVKFPELSKLAQIFLSIPATSISSERLFSKAGILYANTLRNRLSAKMAGDILVVKANLDKVSLAPSIGPDPDDEEDEKSDDDLDKQVEMNNI